MHEFGSAFSAGVAAEPQTSRGWFDQLATGFAFNLPPKGAVECSAAAAFLGLCACSSPAVDGVDILLAVAEEHSEPADGNPDFDLSWQ